MKLHEIVNESTATDDRNHSEQAGMAYDKEQKANNAKEIKRIADLFDGVTDAELKKRIDKLANLDTNKISKQQSADYDSLQIEYNQRGL